MVIVVHPGQSLQDAVNAATPGDTIIVKRGTYTESIVIPEGKDRIRIIGDGCAKTILDGTNLQSEAGITISGADFVTITGFTVTGFSRAGIRIESSDCVIYDVHLHANGDSGLVLERSAVRSLIRSLRITENQGHGITCLGPATYVIECQIVQNHGTGIALGPGADNSLLLENNLSENGSEGVLVHADGCWLIGNQAKANGGDGIVVDDACNVLLYGNNTSGNAGAGLLLDALCPVVIKNHFGNNASSGLSILDDDAAHGLEGGLIIANDVRQNGAHGLAGQGHLVETLLLENTICENQGDALSLDQSRGNRILHNTFDRNQGHGIALSGTAEANVIDANQIEENGAPGIVLGDGATGHSLRENCLRGNNGADIATHPALYRHNVLDRNEWQRTLQANSVR